MPVDVVNLAVLKHAVLDANGRGKTADDVDFQRFSGSAGELAVHVSYGLGVRQSVQRCAEIAGSLSMGGVHG